MEEIIRHERYVSVGTVTKKIMTINPALSAPQIMEIVRRAIRTQGERAGEFAASETLDEAFALELARATVGSA